MILPPAPGSAAWANPPVMVMPEVNLPGVPATVFPQIGPTPVGPNPSVLVVPQVDLSAPTPPAVDEADVVLGEFDACLANGITDIVECLRGRHTSVMIRRLEACLGAERIPPQPDDARPCLASGIR